MVEGLLIASCYAGLTTSRFVSEFLSEIHRIPFFRKILSELYSYSIYSNGSIPY